MEEQELSHWARNVTPPSAELKNKLGENNITTSIRRKIKHQLTQRAIPLQNEEQQFRKFSEDGLTHPQNHLTTGPPAEGSGKWSDHSEHQQIKEKGRFVEQKVRKPTPPGAFLRFSRLEVPLLWKQRRERSPYFMIANSQLNSKGSHEPLIALIFAFLPCSIWVSIAQY